jgi:DNA-binding FadR family transcriptional regulator
MAGELRNDAGYRAIAAAVARRDGKAAREAARDHLARGGKKARAR